MKTTFTDIAVLYYKFWVDRVQERILSLEKLEREEITLEKINMSKQMDVLSSTIVYSSTKFETEIQSSLLRLQNDSEILNYLFYLFKIYFKIKKIARLSASHIDLLKNKYLNEIEEERFFINMPIEVNEYKTKQDIIMDIYSKSYEILSAPIRIYMILKDQFGFKVKDWREINSLEEMPSFFEVKKLIYSSEIKDVDAEKVEILPEVEYKSEAQKIAWLCELGILELVLNKCKDGDTFVWRRAANIVSSFTGMNIDTVRKSLQAIYQPNKENEKNNPMANPSNKIFVEEMRRKFKLN